MKYTLNRTCFACPEQYDLEDDDGNCVAYFRLRHGSFTVDCPDYGGVRVYMASPKGDGIFEEDERNHYLNEAFKAIAKHYGVSHIEVEEFSHTSKYVVAYMSFLDNDLHQKVVYAESERDALLTVLDTFDFTDVQNIEDIKNIAFDADIVVSVICID